MHLHRGIRSFRWNLCILWYIPVLNLVDAQIYCVSLSSYNIIKCFFCKSLRNTKRSFKAWNKHPWTSLYIVNTSCLSLQFSSFYILHCTKNEVFHYGFLQSHLLKKSTLENFIFCAVLPTIFVGVISINGLILFKINSKLSQFILMRSLNSSFDQFNYVFDQNIFCSLLFRFAVFSIWFFWLFCIDYFHDALTYCRMVPTREKTLVMFSIFF